MEEDVHNPRIPNFVKDGGEPAAVPPLFFE
jgi:hypothetical protein